MFLRPAPFLTGLALMLVAPATSGIARAAGFQVHYQPLIKTGSQFSNYIPHRGSGRKDIFQQLTPSPWAVQNLHLCQIGNYSLAWKPRSGLFPFQKVAQAIRSIPSKFRLFGELPREVGSGCVRGSATYPEPCCTWQATGIPGHRQYWIRWKFSLETI